MVKLQNRKMNKILLFGINHKTNQISEREKVTSEELFKSIYATYFPRICSEFLILSTCNRIEILVVTQNAEETREKIKQNTRHFAKRQLTWFRKDKRIHWLDVNRNAPDELISAILKLQEKSTA